MEIEVDAIVGKTWTLRELRSLYDAVFIAVGAGLPVFMDVPGENLKGVYSANEYLTRVNLMGAFRAESDTPGAPRPAGGRRGRRQRGHGLRAHRASAWARTRRSSSTGAARTSCPARREEVHHAEQEGVRFELLAAPLEVLGDEEGWVRALRCIRMELGEPDASGRRRPVEIAGLRVRDPLRDGRGRHRHPLQPAADRVRAGPARSTSGATSSSTRTGMTSLPGVFAGGDIVRGAATVILAMGDGKRAAAAIERYLATVAALVPRRRRCRTGLARA